MESFLHAFTWFMMLALVKFDKTYLDLVMLLDWRKLCLQCRPVLGDLIDLLPILCISLYC